MVKSTQPSLPRTARRGRRDLTSVIVPATFIEVRGATYARCRYSLGVNWSFNERRLMSAGYFCLPDNGCARAGGKVGYRGACMKDGLSARNAD